MEEVDKIIILSLKEIGCEINGSVESLDNFTTELVIEAASKCLQRICPGSDLPSALPVNMAARFQVGASIANACKDLGYTGEVGYQTFLYSNAVEIRKVFIFLIEKLPRDSEKASAEPDDPLSKLKRDIALSIRESLTRRLFPGDIRHVPFISHTLETGISMPGVKRDLSPQEWRNFCVKELKFLTEQSTPSSILPSIIALNSTSSGNEIGPGGSRSSSRVTTPNYVPSNSVFAPNVSTSRSSWLALHENLFKKETKPEPTLGVSDVPQKDSTDQGNKEEMEVRELERLRKRIEELQVTISTENASLYNVSKECQAYQTELREKGKEFEAFHTAVKLLPESENNLKKLEESISVAKQRLLILGAQWETHRKQLIENYRRAKQKYLSRANENEKQIDTIRDLRNKFELIQKQTAVKQSVRDNLQKELEKLPKNINRTSYTVRIMEIISNIKKQKDEIDKILNDTKKLQRDTNQLSDVLDRSFRVVDETIFRNAKKDEHSKKAYKHLATLHSDCLDIIKMVMETGSIIREIRDLEEQCEFESSKNIGSYLERISADISLMKSENTSLSKQLEVLKRDPT